MNYKEYTVRVYKNGTKYWYKNDQLHREGGPAIEYTGGANFWYRNGQCHREDGPAIEWPNGFKTWYIDGECLTEEEFAKRTQSCEGKVVEIDGKKYKLMGV